MATDDQLNELLDRWEELRRINPAVSIEEVCAGHPEWVEPLSRRIEALGRMDALLGWLGPDDAPMIPADEAATSPSDRTFGDYELLEEIARGGVGVVYKARQRNPNRFVALKMIRPDRFAHPSDKARFLVEAETAANLSHPNIIRIHEVGEHRGQLFFSMAYLEGGSLADRIARSPYPEREAASLVGAVALAVHAAHQYGILHRDLKPSNILLDAEGRPHVADFGLAKRIGDDAGMTQTGAILGTPCYMAPEQVARGSQSATTATDVYGLGAILYELLTGRKPFEGASIAETLAQVEQKEPRRPRSIDPRIGRDLESICLKCLEKDPSRRYRSAEALAEDIDRWLAGKPVRARPISPAERSWRWCRRNPLVAGLAGAIVLLSIGSMIGAFVGYTRIVSEQKATAAALKKAETRAVEAEEQRRRAEAANTSVMQGITEPLKKLADPDLARDPDFARMRHEIIQVAIRILDEYAVSLKNDAWSVGFQTHIGLLQTADGDHPGSWDAYRKAIRHAELHLSRLPESGGAWDMLGQAYSHLGMDQWEQGLVSESIPNLRSASEAFERAMILAAPEDYYIIFHHVAWFLVLCPEERFRNPKRARDLAERVAQLMPNHERDNPAMLRGLRPRLLLGLARYRCGDFAGARVPVEESIRFRGGGDAYEGFTLAMILAKLGDRDAGVARYREAELWMRRNRFGDFELHFLRDEAGEALGLTPPPK